MKTLTDAERLDWLQLINSENIGPITFHRLIARFESAGNALKSLPELSRTAGRKSPLRAGSRDDAEEVFLNAEKCGARIIASCEPDYPRLLRHIADAPPIIFLRGHASLLQRNSVAVIGARNASLVGRKMAAMLSEGVGASEYVVSSGLARGIDGAAHLAALKTGTVAVVAGGVDVLYPPEHADLTERIAAAGAIISERAPGVQPTARDFPRRNRLISGLSRGVVVVEAAARSGTLITARFALEQGREVFAVPGSPLDPRCNGSNRLIRDGATLVENAHDIIDALAAQTRNLKEEDRDLFAWADSIKSEPDERLLASVRRQVAELLSFTPVHRDEILREIDAPAGIVYDALLELVITGDAEEVAGGRYTLKASA